VEFKYNMFTHQLESLHGLLFKLLSSLASLKSIMVLPFWYQLAQFVLETRPVNGYSS